MSGKSSRFEAYLKDYSIELPELCDGIYVDVLNDWHMELKMTLIGKNGICYIIVYSPGRFISMEML